MKFQAELRIKKQENAEHLVKAFFKAFNPKNSIFLRGTEVRLEFELEQLSPEVLEVVSEAVADCEILSFTYGKTSIKVEDLFEEEAQENNLEANSPTPEETQEADQYQEKDEFKEKLDEFAQKSASYEEFLNKVLELFEFQETEKQLLMEVMQVLGKVNKIKWETIDEELSKIGIKISWYQKQKLKSCISKKYSVRLIEFIKILEGYKNKFSTLSKKSTEPQEQENINSSEENPAETKNVEELFKKSKLKRRLITLNKRESIRTRITYILAFMEWSFLNSRDQYVVQSICEIAMKLKNINFDDIFNNSKLQAFNKSEYIALFYKFVNRYAKVEGIIEKIDPIDFLKYLQTYVLTDAEKQDLY